MRNILVINSAGGLELLSSTDTGVNSLEINGAEIPESSWVGSGVYSYTYGGATYEITKAPANEGNLQLIQDSTYALHFGAVPSKTTEIVDLIYPVGSIYMSVNAVDPSDLFGGTWVQIKDRFLLAAGDTYANAATGGAATVTLTENQIPAHTHTVQWASYNRGAGNLAASVLDYTGSSKQTGSAGGGAAHNNMPPYLAVNVWRRTA